MSEMLKHIVYEIEGTLVHVYCDDAKSAQLLTEGAQHKGQPLVGPYSYQKHGPHVHPGQRHIHLYRKNDQIFSVNWDGSAHDQSHGAEIPNKVYDALLTKFPELNLPNTKVLEAVFPFKVPTFKQFFTTSDQSKVNDLCDLQRLLNEFMEIDG